MDQLDRTIVSRDLLIAVTNLGIAVMLVSSFGAAPATWTVAAVTAVATGALLAASDRSRVGLWALFGAGVLCGVALLSAVVFDTFAVEYVPWFMLGLAVGAGANRLLFGLLRPVPDLRRRREQSA